MMCLCLLSVSEFGKIHLILRLPNDTPLRKESKMIRKICCLVGGALGFIVVSILVIAYYLHFGYILPGKARVGHLIVTLSDTEGRPITDATVFVKTLNRVGIMSGKYERDYNQFSARTDSNGVADVSFQFLASHFDWRLETPSHHNKAVRFQSDYFSRASNVVYRTMSFFPKRNPRPILSYKTVRNK